MDLPVLNISLYIDISWRTADKRRDAMTSSCYHIYFEWM